MPVPAELIRAGFSPNVLSPWGTGANRVMVLGEAPGELEDDYGVPFYPSAPAGSVLDRAIRRVGMNREQFVITNVVPSRPPNNWLEGAPWMNDAIEWGRPILEAAIAQYKPAAILALGGVALRTATGLAGPKLGVSNLVGYVLPSLFGPPVVACYHPSFLRRGAMNLFGVVMRCVRLAVLVAREGRQAITPTPDSPPSGYILHPTEAQAEDYLLGRSHSSWLALDIETPWSNVEDEAEEHEGDITSIQFSWAPEEGIFMPWRQPFVGIAKKALALPNTKFHWNGYRFDIPRLVANGCDVRGDSVDGMWLWHFSQPDLPRGLQFALAMQGPHVTQPTHSWPWPYKHMNASHEEFYGIADVASLQWLLNY